MEASGLPADGARLAFRLPPFCRTAWVSDAARQLWEPRFKQVRTALEDLAVLGAAGRDRGGKIAVRPDSRDRLRKLAAKHGIAFAVLDAPPAEPSTALATAGRLWIQLGPPGDGLQQARSCSAECSPSRDVLPHDACDPVWAWARRAPGEVLEAGGGLAVSGSWAANPLLRTIGLAATPSWPCCSACRTAAAEAAALAEAAQTHRRGEALDWLQQILSWPMSWSALHGIAEVKTPVLRYVRDTVATGDRLTVQWLGTVMPQTAARGLTFPFRLRPQRAKPPIVLPGNTA